MPASPQKPSTDRVRFGKVTTTPSDATVVTSIAPDDHRALTTTFDYIQVANEEPPKPDAARTFAMTLPFTDGAKGETLSVYVQGTALAAEGADARLTLKLNGQPTVRYYRNGFADPSTRRCRCRRPRPPPTGWRVASRSTRTPATRRPPT
jgi:hypothetical protein